MVENIYKELHAKYTEHPKLDHKNFTIKLGVNVKCDYSIEIHKNLRVLKNIHRKETAIVFGAGSTILDYKEVDDGNFIRVGCNRQFMRDELLPFHLYFLVDGGMGGTHSYVGDIGDLYDEFQPLWGKFYCLHPKHLYENFVKAKTIPWMVRTTTYEYIDYKDDNGKSRDTYLESLDETSGIKFTKDISVEFPMLNSNVAFPIMQFLLYMGFAKIYLVGFDASGGGRWNFPNAYWKTSDYAQNIAQWPKRWYFFRKWQKKEYPDVRVINVNPVALKGMMDDDIYT